MELTLKQRKAVANGALPKFELGTPSLLDLAKEITTVQGMQSLHPSQIVPTNLTNDVMNANIASKVKPAAGGNLLGGIAGKASGIMNIASTGIDFFNTLGDVSKNKMTSDQMMGSGGLTSESANGISYQLSKVDQAGILNQIDATAKAGTMASMGKGAALGGAIGSVIPGLGTVAGGVIGGVVGGIAGLFGSRSAKREAERQKKIAMDRTAASNALNREMAYTIGLRNEFNRENRTDISQSLFHAETGAENLKINPVTGETVKKFKVNTAFGPVWDTANSQTHTGEMIISKLGPSSIVKNGPHDNALTHLRDGDTVVSARKDIISPKTGRPIIFDAYEMAMNNGGVFSEEEKNELDMNLRIGKMMMYAGKRKPDTNTGYLGGTLKKLSLGDENITDIWNKEADTLANNWYLSTNTSNQPKPAPVITNNPQVTTNPTTTTNTGTPGSKTPGFLSKLWGGIKNAGSSIDVGNIVPLVGAFSIAGQRTARAEGLRAPKSSVANQYEQDAIQLLNEIHPDYYPILTLNREIEGRGKFSIAQSGGLSAGQKMAGYMGLANSTQRNNAEAFFNTQERYNAWKALAAKAALEAGNQSATRQQQAYQWDEDMLARAHAAQENMLETSAYDRQNGLTQFFKNLWEKNQFDRTMNLYESQLENDRAKTQAIINSLGTKNNPVTLNGVAGNAAMLQVDPTTGKFVRTNPFSASQLLSEDAKKSIDSLNNIVSAAANAINGANTGTAPKITQPKVLKPLSKKNTTRKKSTLTKDSMGQQFANVVAKPLKKNKPVTTKAEEKKSAKPVEKYTPIPFGNPALQERFPNASEEAKKDRPFKERPGRPAATTNSEQRRRALEWFILGKKRYEEKYGKD